MDKLTVLRHRFDRTAWKDAFAQALLRLRPDMNPDAADEVSDSEVIPNHARDPFESASDWAALNGGDTMPSNREIYESPADGDESIQARRTGSSGD
jgi:hypothetical protein